MSKFSLIYYNSHNSQIFSDEKKRVIKEAQKILNHNFKILSKNIHFGKKINWHSNFAGKNWPIEPYEKFRTQNYDFDSKKYLGDIKLPWELNKHLYLQDLAKAYLNTRDEKYSREFVSQIEDWLQENPYMVGVNWTEGLIASHRAISWVIALSSFVSSSNITKQFLKSIYWSLFQHTLFIEKTYEFDLKASNHLLGELCAQIVLSIFFSEFKDSHKRMAEAIKYLEKELNLQVYKDGVDYEQSTSYQRVILEFLYLPLILAKREELVLPKKVWKVAEKMTEFMMHMTQPNGSIQPISDADGARVFILGNDINDFRPHLNLAAWLFNRGDFKFVGQNHFSEVIWFMKPEEIEKLQKIKAFPPKQTSVAFTEGGYWVSRQGWSKDSLWLFFDCGHIGMGQWLKDISVGVHGHSDTLNFGLSLGQETFLTDKGSYCYTTEKPFHQYFRSSRAHNLPIVDGQDENLIDQRPWHIRQLAEPKNTFSFFSRDYDYLKGQHTGYRRLAKPVLCQREILFLKKKDFLILKDTFRGLGKHQISQFFHFLPEIEIKPGTEFIQTISKNQTLVIQPLFENDIEIIKGQTHPPEGWYAPNFGKKLPAPVVKINFKIEAPQSCYYLISRGKQEINKEKIIKIFEEITNKVKRPKIVMVDRQEESAKKIQKKAQKLSQDGFQVAYLKISDYIDQSFSIKKIYRLIKARNKSQITNLYFNLYAKNRILAHLLNIIGKLKKIISRSPNPPRNISTEKDWQRPALPVIDKNWNLINYYFFNQQILRELKSFEPDLILLFGYEALLASCLTQNYCQAKIIIAPGNHLFKFKKSFFLKNYLKILLKQVDIHLKKNDDLKKFYQKYP
ncbi:MAG: alginate lyase family protein [Patescibacteria group bacterium]